MNFGNELTQAALYRDAGLNVASDIRQLLLNAGNAAKRLLESNIVALRAGFLIQADKGGAELGLQVERLFAGKLASDFQDRLLKQTGFDASVKIGKIGDAAG